MDFRLYSIEVILFKDAGLKWKGLKFIYSEKATKFCEIFLLLLTTVHTVKSKGKISQNFVAFSKYMNFTIITEKLGKWNFLKLTDLYVRHCL